MASYIKPDGKQLVIDSDLNFSNLATHLSTESALLVKGGAYVNNDLYIGGTLIANGDVITLGNASGSLALNANISSDLLPSTANTYDIGSNANSWKQLNIQTVIVSTTTETTEVTAGTSLSAIDGTTALTLVLADGTEGQNKIITVSDTPAGPITVTPSNGAGFTSITFTAKGDSASLVFVNSSWNIVSVFRSSVNV
jgi:hypothetical protein